MAWLWFRKLPAFLSKMGPGSSPRRRRSHSFRPILEPLEDRTVPSITGLVFQDYDANGVFNTSAALNNGGQGAIGVAVDHGLAGVTVSAYNAAGVQAAVAVTSANGTFTLAGTTAGQTYRVEFTNLPAGFAPGPHGANDGTTVQFVDGGASNVDLGLVQPATYSVDNPLLVTSQYWFGNPANGPSATQAALVALSYSGGSAFSDPSASTSAHYTTPAMQTLATVQQVGATWGVTYDAQNQTVYASAFFKKHTGFGPDGPGAIYQIPITFNPITGAATAGTPTVLTTLSAGPNAHDTNDYDTDDGNAGWNAVGQTSLGGLAVSTDGSTLYVMNLADRKLYIIPTANPAAAQAVALPTPADATGPLGSPGGDLRPFAVAYYNKLVYVGMVNSAETTQNRNDLHAYVYSYNPKTGVFAQVLEIADLTYARSYAENFHQVASADWLPWSPTYKSLVTDNTVGVYPQPMLTGITFDASGDMVLGLRDRSGDQFGFFALDDPNAGQTNVRVQGVGAGDTLRATPSGAGWTIESDIYANVPSHFYSNQSWGSFHTAVMVGGVLNVPGFPDVVVSAFDAANTSQPRTGGLRWFNDAAGNADKAYTIYATSMTNNDPSAATFGKANGIGGLTYITPPAPIELGNRVWLDVNDNGVQDANEPGIPGVHVHLYDANGNLVGSTTTDAGGDYYFNASDVTNINGFKGILPGAAYSVRLNDPADYGVGGPLFDLRPATAGAGSDQAVDSNGGNEGPADVGAAVVAGGVGVSNHTIDFGFAYDLSLGDLVWRDSNNNGVVDPGEAGVPGVLVALLNGAGQPVLSPNGQPMTTTTDASGHYLFTGLNPGVYEVRISPPSGYISSTGATGSPRGPYEPGLPGTNFTNNADHGTEQPNGSVLAGPVTLAAPGSAANPDDQRTANLRQDFGLFPVVTISSTIWNDVNGNGIQDPGEPGIAGVTVHLYGSGGQLLATAVTDATGHYVFSNDPRLPGSSSQINGLSGLAPDALYFVRLDDPADYLTGGPLAGFSLTRAFVGPNSQVNSTGLLVNGVVTADVFTGDPGSTTLIFNFGFTNLLSKRRFIH